MKNTRQILVTAGATRNPIDSMRSITANASGRTGSTIASFFPESCHILGSPIAINRAPVKSSTEEFTSTRDLMTRMKTWVQSNQHGLVIHSAAVGDYEFAGDMSGKLKSGQPELILRFTPTPKILNHIKKWSPDTLLLSFKAAPPASDDIELERLAKAQSERSGSDMVFANVLGRLQNKILLYQPTKIQWYTSRTEAIQAVKAWITENRYFEEPQ